MLVVAVIHTYMSKFCADVLGAASWPTLYPIAHACTSHIRLDVSHVVQHCIALLLHILTIV
jgi:hypothetical protein